MSEDVASLEIRVKSSEVDTAGRRLDDLSRKGSTAERATSGLTSSFTRLLGPVAGVVSVLGGFNKVISTQREFDVLNAGLQTATGSLENSTEAFAALQKFASDTPYSLSQTTEAFTKLVNLGLTPSEKALTAYGNTAAAMGKDLNQLIEAVADATTGEFERLKEFGIKTRQEGDKVSFTFRGVTETIGNNAKEIEGYLMSLGQNEFAGAMEKRMMSLDGLISNLGDEWDKLFLNLSQKGIGGVIEGGVKLAINALTELNTMFASGETEAYIDGIVGKFSGFGADIESTIEILTRFYDELKGNNGEAVSAIIDTFKNLPENVRAFVQLMVVEVASSLDKVTAYSSAFKDGIAAIFNDDTLENVGNRLRISLSGIDSAREESITTIMRERDVAISSFDAQIKKGQDLRAEYDKTQSVQMLGVDRLAKYQIKATGELNSAQKKLMDEYRISEEKATLSSVDFQIKEVEREAARKLAIAGDNADLRAKVEAEAQEKIKKIRNSSISAAVSGEDRLTEVVRSETEERLNITRKAASEAITYWSQANVDKAARTGGQIMNAGTPGEFVSSWDANNNYVGDLGTWSSSPRGYDTGFATGGEFTVGGSGGIDSQMVRFKATPGEKVKVTPLGAGSSSNSNQGGVVFQFGDIIIQQARDAKDLVNQLRDEIRKNPLFLNNSFSTQG